MKFYVLTAVLLLCFTSLVAQDFTVSGLVVDQVNKAPIVGAKVALSHNNNQTQMQTNVDGQFSFSLTDIGNYYLLVSYLGYVSYQDTIYVDKNITNFEFELTPSYTELDEIVVTGTGTEHYLKDAPVQTEVISGKALKEYAGRSIEDILGGLSSSLSFTQNDMGSNLQLNGLKNDYILILIDGRRINGDVGGQNDLNRINMNNVDRIEIVKGAVSSLYGSDAIGGVINFISKKDKDKLSFTNTTRVGEHGDINQSNNINWSNKHWNTLTSFNLKHTDGWQNTDQEWYRGKLYINSVSKTVNRSTNYSFTQDIAYKFNEALTINADASFFQKWTYRPMGIPQWRAYDFYYRDQTYGLGGKYNLTDKNFITLDASYDQYDYYYDYTGREYTYLTDKNGEPITYFPGDHILQSSQRRFLTNLKGVFYLGKYHTLNTGVEYIWDKLISEFRLDGDRAITYSMAIYAQDEWNITERLNLTTGLRYGHNKDFENIVTPKISAMYKLGSFNIRGTYSNGYKAPTVKELYYHYYSTIMGKYKAYYGNKNLKAQKSNYYSFNLEYVIPQFKIGVTGYHNNIRDMISLQQTITSYEDQLMLVEETMKYVNLSKARTYGIDVMFEMQLPYNIKFGGGYSWLDAKAQRTDDDEATDYMKYVPINGSSRNNFSVKASWNHTWVKYILGINLNGRYQSKRYYTSDGDAKAFQIWRLNTSHNLINKKALKLDMNVGVDNIFNYIDRTPFGHNRGTTSPGRNFYTSVSLKFQNNK